MKWNEWKSSCVHFRNRTGTLILWYCVCVCLSYKSSCANTHLRRSTVCRGKQMFCNSGWGGVLMKMSLTRACLCGRDKYGFSDPCSYTSASVPQSQSCVVSIRTLLQTGSCRPPLHFLNISAKGHSTAIVCMVGWPQPLLCRCPTWRWLQRTFWRFSSPGSPRWTWGQPTPTSAWLWPAFWPSLTAPQPVSSVHRLTVSRWFTPSKPNTQSNTPGGKRADKVQTFCVCLLSPQHMSAHTNLSHAHQLCSNRCVAYQHLTLWHALFWSSCCSPQSELCHSNAPDICLPK